MNSLLNYNIHRHIHTGLALLEYGFYIIPVHHPLPDGGCSCTKGTECFSSGKHPCIKEWPKNASNDPAMIKSWAEQWPECNWGILTGSTSGVVVLDIDPRNGGIDSLEELEQQYGLLPETPMVLTGGGGFHYYFKCPGCSLPKKTNLWPGVDLQAEGAFVVAPGSIHTRGRLYEWEVEHHPEEISFADLPAWILNTTTGKEVNKSGSKKLPDIVIEGGRNVHLTSLAGTMRRKGMGEAAISAALIAENLERCNPPLSEFEVKGIAASVSKYDPASEAIDVTEPDQEKQSRKTQSDMLIEAALNATLFHDEHKEPYAVIWVNNHNEVYGLNQKGAIVNKKVNHCAD